MPNLNIQRSAEYGSIEPDDRSWIIFLNKDGRPGTYWSRRGADGEVIGEPVLL